MLDFLSGNHDIDRIFDGYAYKEINYNRFERFRNRTDGTIDKYALDKYAQAIYNEIWINAERRYFRRSTRTLQRFRIERAALALKIQLSYFTSDELHVAISKLELAFKGGNGSAHVALMNLLDIFTYKFQSPWLPMDHIQLVFDYVKLSRYCLPSNKKLPERYWNIPEYWDIFSTRTILDFCIIVF